MTSASKTVAKAKPFTEEELKSWKWPIIIVLMLAVVAIVGWLVYTTPGLFGTPVKSEPGPPNGDAVNPAVVAMATSTPTPGQEKTLFTNTDWQAKLEADKKDPILAERINRWITPRGEVLIPINSIPKEFKLYHQELNVYIVDLTMDSEGGMTGIIENRGVSTVKIFETGFLFVGSDYKWIGTGISKINEQFPTGKKLYIAPGERKSFTVTKPPYSASEIATAISLSPPVVIDAKNNEYGI